MFPWSCCDWLKCLPGFCCMCAHLCECVCVRDWKTTNQKAPLSSIDERSSRAPRPRSSAGLRGQRGDVPTCWWVCETSGPAGGKNSGVRSCLTSAASLLKVYLLHKSASHLNGSSLQLVESVNSRYEWWRWRCASPSMWSAVMHCGPVSRPQLKASFPLRKKICCVVLCLSFRKKTQSTNLHEVKLLLLNPLVDLFCRGHCRQAPFHFLSLVVWFLKVLPLYPLFHLLSAAPLSANRFQSTFGIQIGSYPRHFETSVEIAAG